MKLKIIELEQKALALNEERLYFQHELELAKKELGRVGAEEDSRIAILNQQLIEMKGGLDHANIEVQSLKDKEEQKGSDVDEMVSVQFHKDEMTHLFARLESKDDAVRALREKLSTLRLELSDSRHKFEFERKESERCRLELEKFKEIQNEMKLELDANRERQLALEHELRDMRVDLSIANKENAEIGPTVAVLKSEKVMLCSQLEEVNNQLSAMRSEVVSYKKQLTIATNALAISDKSLATSEMNIATKEKEIISNLDRVAMLENERRGLQATLEQTKSDLAESLSLCKTQGSELDEVNTVVEGLEMEIKELKESNGRDDHSKSFTALDSKCNEMKQKLSQAHLQLASASSSMELMEEELTAIRAKCQLLETEVQELRARVDLATADSIDHAKDAEVAKDALALSQEQLRSQDTEISSLRENIKGLRAKISLLETDLKKEVDKNILSVQQQMKSSDNLELDVQLRETEVSLARVEMALRQSQAEVGGLKAQLSSKSDRISQLEEITNDQRSTISEGYIRADGLLKQNTQLEERLRSEDANSAELRATLAILNVNFDKLTRELQTLSEYYDSHSGLMRGDYEEKYDAILKQKVDCEHSNAELAKEISRLWKELNISDQSRRSADDSLLLVQKRYSSLESDLRTTKLEYSRSQMELSKCQAENADLSKALDSALEEDSKSADLITKLETKLVRAEDKINSLQSETNALQSEQERAQKELARSTTDMLRVSEKAGLLESALSASNERLTLTREELQQATLTATENATRVKDQAEVIRSLEHALTVNREEVSNLRLELGLARKDNEHLSEELTKVDMSLGETKECLAMSKSKQMELEKKVTLLVAGSTITPKSSRSDLSKEDSVRSQIDSQHEEIKILRKTIAGVREELAESRLAWEMVSKDLVQSQTDLERLQMVKASLEKELVAARERQKAYDEDMRASRIERTQLQQDLSRLSPQLAVSENKIEGLLQNQELIRSELAQIQTRNSELNAQVVPLQAHNSQLHGELTAMTKVKDELETKLVEAREKVVLLDYQLKVIKEECAITEINLAKSLKQLKTQNNELDEVNAVVEGLEEELREAREKESTVSVTITPMNDSINSSEQLMDLTRQIEESTLKLNASISGSELLQEEISALTARNAELEGLVNMNEGALKSMTTEMLAMREEYEVAQSLLEETQESLERREKSLEAAVRGMEEMTQRNQSLQNILDKLGATVATFTETKAGKAVGTQVLELELQKTRGDLETTRMELTVSQRDLKKLQATYNHTVDRCKALEEISVGVREELAAAQARSDGFAKDVYYLEDKLRTMEIDNARKVEGTEEKIPDVDLLKHTLQSTIERLERELEEKSQYYSEQFEFFKKERIDCEHSNAELAKEISRLWNELQISEASRTTADGNIQTAQTTIAELVN